MKLGLISAFLAIIIFIVGTTAAMIAYPNYSFFKQYLSELGMSGDVALSEGCVISKVSHPEIFNISLIFTGVFLIPFFPSAYFILHPRGKLRQILISLMSMSGVTTSIFLLFIGIFDAKNFLSKHIMAALGLYYSLVATCFLWSMGILFLHRDSPYKQSKLWIVDPIACIFGILIGLINTGVFRLHNLFCSKLTLAFYQKILTYGFIIFLGYILVRLMIIYNKHECKHPREKRIRKDC